MTSQSLGKKCHDDFRHSKKFVLGRFQRSPLLPLPLPQESRSPSLRYAITPALRSQLAVEEYYKVAQKHGISLTQMSLAFVNMQPFVDSNIIGATKLDQLEENINSVHIELSDEIIAEINAIHENNPSPAP